MSSQAQPVSGDFFVALFDLANFSKFYRSQSGEKVFKALSEFSHLVKPIVEKAGGQIVKFSNDSGIAVFPSEQTDQGVLAMIKLKKSVDEWLSGAIPGSYLAMNAHVGPANTQGV